MPTPSLPLSFAQNYSRFMNSSTSCYFLTEGRQMAQEMNSHIFRMNKLQNCRLKTFNCTLNICLTFCRGRLTLSLCRSCRTSLMLRLPSPFLSASAKVCFSHVIIQRVKKSEAWSGGHLIFSLQLLRLLVGDTSVKSIKIALLSFLLGSTKSALIMSRFSPTWSGLQTSEKYGI